MKRRKQRGRLLRRDNRLCGVHLEGCGHRIKEGDECNVDHIIPSAFFSKVSGRCRNLYERDWNCQPMHSGCNTSKAADLAEWPKFRCNCHFLQVEDGHLFVRARGRAGSEKHLLLPNVVSPGRNRVDARMVIGPGKLGGQEVQGASVGMKAEFGYMLPGIAAANVDWFNLHEKARVGLQIPKRFEVTKEGRVIPIGAETVKGCLRDGNYDHFPLLRTPEGGLAVFGRR